MINQKKTTLFIGHFGSGKTEIAINYAISLKNKGYRTQIVDLDLVNPYFRSREARDYMESLGINVVAPKNEYAFADLPILLRGVRAAISDESTYTVFDVGGDDLGAKVLGGLSSYFIEQKSEVLLVLNERRPFTDSKSGLLKIKSEIEKASRLKVTALVSNTHLMNETTFDIINGGIHFSLELSKELNLPLKFASIEKRLLQRLDSIDFKCSILEIERFMTMPWDNTNRRGPIGRPPSFS